MELTKAELAPLIRQLEKIFDVVRLVDARSCLQYGVDGQGNLTPEPCRCYAVWDRKERCANCISEKVLRQKGKLTKFEFIDQDVYTVLAMYVEVEGAPYVLETVVRTSGETLLGADGQSMTAENISNFNRLLYVDPVTGAYNRQYYEDRLRDMIHDGVAMLDLDNFKQINDSCGHAAGDEALRLAVQAMRSCVRSTDAVVRYGGDEFLVVFRSIQRDAFSAKLEQIRGSIHDLALPSCPGVRISASIGGVYGPRRTVDMIHAADGLLYVAKTEKDSVCTEDDMPCTRHTAEEDRR